MRFQLGEAKLKHGKEADRPRANNNDTGGSAVSRIAFPPNGCLRLVQSRNLVEFHSA